MKILLFCLIPYIIFAKAYYVDNYAPSTGNGSINSPFSSLNDAINISQPGDSIVLRGSHSEYGQIYFEDIDLPHEGNINKRITLQNYSDEVVVISIKSNFKIDENYWTFSGIIFEDLKSNFGNLDFSGKNNYFYNCVFRTKSLDFFEQGKQQNNHFEFCKIEN